MDAGLKLQYNAEMKQRKKIANGPRGGEAQTGLALIPDDLHQRFLFEETRHAAAIMATDLKTEFRELLDCLRQFELLRSEIVVGGGG